MPRHRSPGRRWWYPDLWDFQGGPVLHWVDPRAGLDLTVWVSRHWRGSITNLQPEEHDAIGWFGTGQLDGLSFADLSYPELLRRLLSA